MITAQLFAIWTYVFEYDIRISPVGSLVILTDQGYACASEQFENSETFPALEL